MTKLAASAILCIIVSVALFSVVRAETYDVSGNAPGSSNSINIVNKQSSTIIQGNNADITNNADAEADTGGNSGGNQVTGDASAEENLINRLNRNFFTQQPCCTPKPEPTDKPANGQPSPTPEPGKPTPTSAPGIGGGGNGGGNGGNGGGDGNGGNGIGGGDVMALSATSGPDTVNTVLTFGGILCLGAGAVLKRYVG
ncbi:hypothetical protein A2Z33_00980 [Candidatus Gottesmanbacteria bacterium RBG_16_52_11]|uniref:Gram-positive cocci surface proteins LPxTG domain-containing protein n=1 Tax=Candidatus Gottesmanbacteria bacterium RBG_16_52_11 TaxID=1798374 RepID=A0A1F5YNT6_9BACT|nr:MAG: hypothetical protein A2Z33_00980 [Candidatus Gottesmanbacteria bacterium RBG_16_52_11]